MSKLSPERLAYYRSYYNKNKEKILADLRLWRNKNKDRINTEKRERYWSDPEHRRHINESRADLYKKIRHEVLSHYSDGLPTCKHCGIVDLEVLCIDHIVGGGKKIRQTTNLWGAKLCWYLKRNNYPLGFQVLCANCNMKKRIREEG